MNALSIYLLMSLAFVFGAMAEFALVLFVQRNLEQESTTLMHSYDRFDSEGKVSPKSTIIGEELGKTAPHKKPRNRVDETKVPKMSFCKRIVRNFCSLHLTTMIDIVAFLVFNLSYAIFNIIYFTCIK